ncbi:unnamed protein product, partial [Mesorhabditis belari]|uniref:Protein kinase domain-containing protein n=1 Tax=Mesorhabditis belari TaxID=2138241 RepID=A0AAF3J9H3_9BILA
MGNFIPLFIFLLFHFQSLVAQLANIPENCKNVSIHGDKTGCTLGKQLHAFLLLNGDDEVDKHFELLKRILQPCINAQGNNVQSKLNFVTMNGSVIVDFNKLTRQNFHYVDASKQIPQSKLESLMLQIVIDYYSGKETHPVAYVITNNPCNKFREFFPETYNDTEYVKTLAGAMRKTGLILRYLWTKPNLLDPKLPGVLSTCGMNWIRDNAMGYFDYEIIDLDDPTVPERYGLCGSNGLDAPFAENPHTVTNPDTTTTAGKKSGTNLFQVIGIIVVVLVISIFVFLIIRRLFFRNWAPRFVRRWFTNVSVRLLGSAGVQDHVIRDFESTMRKNDYPCPDEAPKPPTVGNVSLRRSDNGGYEYPVMSPMKREDLWEIEPLSLQISNQKLGAGAYAVVFSGTLRGAPPVTKVFPTMQLSYCLSTESNEVAVKLTHSNAKADDLMDFIQEIEFMKKLEYCPHLLSMLGCSTDPKYPVLITELCERGDLLHLVRDIENEAINETEKLKFNELLPLVWQVSDGLAYLKSRKIIHRDVAARNVLITGENMAKLSDFGLCRYNDQMFYTTRGGKLPIKWMAPESFEYAIFTSKTDVWSFGVLLWEVYSYGKTPYTSVQPDEMLKHLKDGGRLEIPERTPEWMVPLMASCWAEKADERPDIDTIQQAFYSMMEADADSYGYLQFSKNYYKVSPPDPSSLPAHTPSAKPNEYVIS